MLISRTVLEGIREGRITLAFRRWRRLSVRTGGTLLTAAGRLAIRSVAPVTVDRITDGAARGAGYRSREALLADLGRVETGQLYRIEFGSLGPDPRVLLRETPLTGSTAYRDLVGRLDRLDARASEGAWTRDVLRLLRAHPAVRAGDLCGRAGQEKDRFKINVRKLKALGLTESLETGYRLSPRGEALMDRLDRPGRGG